jgi:hypothetical protein
MCLSAAAAKHRTWSCKLTVQHIQLTVLICAVGSNTVHKIRELASWQKSCNY